MLFALLALLACADDPTDRGDSGPAQLDAALADTVPAAWGSYCVVLTAAEAASTYELRAIELASGDQQVLWTLVDAEGADDDAKATTLDFDGTHLLLGAYGLSGRLDAATGELEPASWLQLVAVAWDEDVIAWAYDGSTPRDWFVFDDYAAADAWEGGEALHLPPDLRVALDGDQAWVTIPSDDTVDLLDLRTGEEETLPLEGFSGWVWGLDLFADELLLLNDGRTDAEDGDGGATIYRFDRETGAALGALDLGLTGATTGGLVCQER